MLWGTHERGTHPEGQTLSRFAAAHGNWQEAVAEVPIVLDSFTVAETTVETSTWVAMGSE